MQKIKFRLRGDHCDSFATPGKLRSVFFDVTNRCNLSCKYCFNHRALQSAYQMVMARADKIINPARRQSFLERVPINRQIVQEVAARGIA